MMVVRKRTDEKKKDALVGLQDREKRRKLEIIYSLVMTIALYSSLTNLSINQST